MICGATVFVVLLLAARPTLPGEVGLTVEGLVRSHERVLVGSLVGLKRDPAAEAKRGRGRGAVATLRVDEVVQGEGQAGDEVEVEWDRAVWRRLEGEGQPVVIFLDPTSSVVAKGAGGAGERLGAGALAALRAAAEEEAAQPMGSISALGMHLGEADASPRGVSFPLRIENLSEQAWRVNADLRAPANAAAAHRTLWVRIDAAPAHEPGAGEAADEGNAAGRKRPAPPLYRSDRPWVHRGMTGGADPRPLRPQAGAEATLEPGVEVTGQVELRRVRGDAWQVLIHGVPDGNGVVRLASGEYRLEVGFDDDYHYWRRSGAHLGRTAEPRYWGRFTSNTVRFSVGDDGMIRAAERDGGNGR